MKKLLSIFTNPLLGLAIGGGFFLIALINSLIVGASSMADLSWWGKAATVGFCIILAGLFVRFFIIPIGKWLVSLVN